MNKKRREQEKIAFNYLSKDEQIRVLFQSAVYLTILTRKNVAVLLFKTPDYFVDVYKCRKTGIILKARAFRSAKQLYKYQLDYISFGRCLIRIDYI